MARFIANNEILEVLKERVSSAAVEAGDMRMSFIEKEIFGSLIDEVIALRRAKASSVTAESAPSYLLGLMEQVKACNTPEELRELRSRVSLSDLNTAIGSIDQAIEKLSNL